MKRNKLWLVRFNRITKRLFDILLSILFLIIFSPLFLYLIYKITRDGGSAIYGHERVGLHGKRFKCYKFRSMVMNSQDVLKNLLDNDPEAKAEWDKDFKLKNDPRITSIGQLIRKTSLDELPQLWNVIKGEMSLVGPRPIIEDELERYGAYSKYYLAVRPGITGLWQVSGRNDISYRERVRLDVRYVITWTFWRDIIILFKTISVVCAGRGAY